MKVVRCRDKQCNAEIAVTNGPVRKLTCPECKKTQKHYTESKGIRFKLAAR